ncbi:MAG TPA: zf-HC2 domain-containing protein, partial [Gemmatimonadaceae bacterium]
MVDCPRDDIRDLLPDLVHDQLEPEARARVEQHLADCAACAAELELLRALRASAFDTSRVDADRIAAAVRGAMAGSGASAQRESDLRESDPRESDVVPIGGAHRRLGSAARGAGARRA